MKLTVMQTPELRASLGIELDDGGRASEASLARLIMEPLEVWGAARRQAVTLFVHQRLDLAGLLDAEARERLKQVFDALLEARDVERARLDGEFVVVRVPPRVVILGEQAFVSGTIKAPGSTWRQSQAVDLLTRLTRWLPSDGLASRADHPASDFEESDLREWVGLPGHSRHTARRRRASSQLVELWGALEQSAVADARAVLHQEDYRFVGGAPGDLFGSADRPTRRSRWRPLEQAEPGLWCAARRGLGAGWSTPTLCHVGPDGQVKALDLYDWDEWRWALLARGVARDAPEIFWLAEGSIRQTCPLPRQLGALMQVVTSRDADARWRWLGPTAVLSEVASVLSDVGGLRARSASSAPPSSEAPRPNQHS